MMIILIVALVLVLVAGAAGYYILHIYSKQQQSDDDRSKDVPPKDMMGPVSIDNFASLFNRLRPDSTHMDVLLGVVAMDDVLLRTVEEMDKIEEMREKRKKQLDDEKARKGGAAVDFDDLVNAGGWGDDNDDDDEADEGDEMSELKKKAKEEEKRKEAEMANLRKAQGKDLPPMEGLDEGVLGQQWVERKLQKIGAWPPELGKIAEETFLYKPKAAKRAQKFKPLHHPAFRRCLCMIMGRLHSAKLNSDPELLEAGAKKLVDETYFKSAMEFRGKVGLILDASLRVALSLQSSTLFTTLVETLSAFKIGCVPTDPKSLPTFNGTMARQYGTLPRLEVGELSFEAPKEDEKEESIPLSELVAGEQAVLVLPVDRKHAEAFTKAKIAQCQKQGIPPQIALQGYREGWWFLVRWEALDKKNTMVEANEFELAPSKFLEQLDAEAVKRYESIPSAERIRTAFPMIVQNIAQKAGAVKIRVAAPKHPGSYKLHLSVKSQDFMGADLDKDIVMKVAEANGEPKKEK